MAELLGGQAEGADITVRLHFSHFAVHNRNGRAAIILHSQGFHRETIEAGEIRSIPSRWRIGSRNLDLEEEGLSQRHSFLFHQRSDRDLLGPDRLMTQQEQARQEQQLQERGSAGHPHQSFSTA